MADKYSESQIMAEDSRLSKVLIAENAWDNTYEIAMRIDGNVATGVEIKKLEMGMPTQPFLNLHKNTMQEIFNRMWELGFRPKDGTGNSGHIESMKYHLEDMRKLVFGKKEPNG